MKKIFCNCVFIVCAHTCILAQNLDSLYNATAFYVDSTPKINWEKARKGKDDFSVKKLLLPASLITFGAISLSNHHLKSLNQEVKSEIWIENPHQKSGIDNFLVFSPAIAVYGLNALGVKGKNNFRDRTIIYALSNMIVFSSVYATKNLAHEQRPDGSDYYSFPSGHTATAFAAAEFMRMEYKDVSPWYGIAGYTAAAATGYLRMYNNKHWLGDVVAGAGIGILSTRIAYWVYPSIKRAFFKDKPVNSMIMPYYQPGKGAGVSMVVNLK
jgi:hypothetical protein